MGRALRRRTPDVLERQLLDRSRNAITFVDRAGQGSDEHLVREKVAFAVWIYAAKQAMLLKHRVRPCRWVRQSDTRLTRLRRRSPGFLTKSEFIPCEQAHDRDAWEKR